jgi:hypothetical protein
MRVAGEGSGDPSAIDAPTKTLPAVGSTMNATACEPPACSGVLRSFLTSQSAFPDLAPLAPPHPDSPPASATKSSAPRLRHQDRASPHASAPPRATTPWESASSSFIRAAGVAWLALAPGAVASSGTFSTPDLYYPSFAGLCGLRPLRSRRCVRCRAVAVCFDPSSLSGGELGKAFSQS